MSVPHSDTPSNVEGRDENWFQNARKQVFPDKVDWSVSTIPRFYFSFVSGRFRSFLVVSDRFWSFLVVW